MSAMPIAAPELTLAPWVVARPDGRGGSYLLGPRFDLLHVSAPPDRIAAIDDPDGRRQLAEAGFLAPAEAPRAGALPATSARPAAAELILIGPPELAADVAALAAALARRGAAVATWLDVARPPPWWRDRAPGAAGVWLGAREPGDPAPLAAGWLGAAPLIWCGECEEGLHVGPRFESAADAGRYREASRTWSTVARLESLGFGDEWPSSLVPRVRRDPDAVAAALLRQRDAAPEAVVLLPGGEEKLLWTAACRRPVRPEELRSRLTWSKGLVRDLEVRPCRGVDQLYVASCASPCAADPFFEWNFGKASDADTASAIAIGEAIERFSAWRANRACDVDHGIGRAYSLADFHPSGPGWDGYRERGMPPVPLTGAIDLLSGEPARVPAFLVPFPWDRAQPAMFHDFDADTAGLAAFPDRTGAILRGALEILERHDFYPAFLWQRPGVLLPDDALPPGPAASAAARLDALGVRRFLVVYPGELALPIVHAFLFDGARGYVCRGTGSGLELESAAARALGEALLSREESESLGDETGECDRVEQPAFSAWAQRDIALEIVDYLQRMPTGRPEIARHRDDAALLEAIKDRLRAAARPLLVADLPCPVLGWSAVRVLIPGLTCHQHPSESAGGRRLIGAPFRHPVPT